MEAVRSLAREAARHVLACGDEWEPAVTWLLDLVVSAPSWKRSAFLALVARYVADDDSESALAASGRLLMLSMEAENEDVERPEDQK